jgi:hypothetical protein
MKISQWVEDLYAQASVVIGEIESQSSHLYAISVDREVPILDPSDAEMFLRRFDDVLRPVTSNFPLQPSDLHKEIVLDIVTGFFSKRIRELGISLDDALAFSRMDLDIDPDWIQDVARPLLLTVVSNVSIAGALNSARGTGKVHDGPVCELFFANEPTIVRAFLSLEDPLKEFLSRTHQSDLAQCGGVLLSYANAAEVMQCNIRQLEQGDAPAEWDYSHFHAFALREMLSYEGDVPVDFWPMFFETAYEPHLNAPAALLPGTYEWAKERELLPLFGELSERYPTFLDALVVSGEFKNPGRVISDVLGARSPSGPDFSR